MHDSQHMETQKPSNKQAGCSKFGKDVKRAARWHEREIWETHGPKLIRLAQLVQPLHLSLILRKMPQKAKKSTTRDGVDVEVMRDESSESQWEGCDHIWWR